MGACIDDEPIEIHASSRTPPARGAFEEAVDPQAAGSHSPGRPSGFPYAIPRFARTIMTINAHKPAPMEMAAMCL